MKPTILPVIAYLAAIAAFVLFPVSAVVASIALSAAGMASILAADYGRDFKPLRVPAPVVPVNVPHPALIEHRIAA